MKALSVSVLALLLTQALSARAMATTPIKSCTAEFKSKEVKDSLVIQAEIYADKGSHVAKLTELADGKPGESEEDAVTVSSYTIRPNFEAALGDENGPDLNDGEMQFFMASHIEDAEIAVFKSKLNFDPKKARSVTIYSIGNAPGTAFVEAYDKAGTYLGSYLMYALSVANCR